MAFSMHLSLWPVARNVTELLETDKNLVYWIPVHSQCDELGFDTVQWMSLVPAMAAHFILSKSQHKYGDSNQISLSTVWNFDEENRQQVFSFLRHKWCFLNLVSTFSFQMLNPECSDYSVTIFYVWKKGNIYPIQRTNNHFNTTSTTLCIWMKTTLYAVFSCKLAYGLDSAPTQDKFLDLYKIQFFCILRLEISFRRRYEYNIINL